MKKIAMKTAVVLAISCICLLGVVFGVYLGIKTDSQQQCRGMPPGWGLETNGEEWRWVDTDGSSWLPLDTKERTIENAWEHYNYEEKQERMKWRRVETPNN